MKRIIFSLAIVVSALMIAAPAFAAWSVTASRHNFSTSNVLGSNQTTGTNSTDRVCVFCHTPHGSQNRGTDVTNNEIDAPLWNRKINTASSYSVYDASPTMNSVPGQPTGNSLACLSCHDGTVALDALVNAPGSGGYVAGGAANLGWDFKRGAIDGFSAQTYSAGTNTMAEFATALGVSTYVPYLATDLSNDHPISMDYPGPGVGNSSDLKFFTAVVSANTRIAMVDETTTFGYRSIGANLNATDGDIRLFKDSTGGFQVQCASCHNPHGTQDGTSNNAYPTFLQRTNDSSTVCISCHIK